MSAWPSDDIQFAYIAGTSAEGFQFRHCLDHYEEAGRANMLIKGFMRSESKSKPEVQVDCPVEVNIVSVTPSEHMSRCEDGGW